MDFFGILYDMKNGKKVPYNKSYFDTLFAAELGGSDVKTLTGTLPLAFRTSETALRSWTIYGNDFQQEESKSTRLPLSFYTDEDKLRDWTIYGNNYEHKYSTSGTLPLTFTAHTAGAASDWSIRGNDNIGKNLLEITGNDELITNGITYTHNKYDHTIIANGKATGNAFYACGNVTLKADMQYFLSGCPAGGSVTPGSATYLMYISGHSDWGYDTGNGLVLPIMTEDTVVTIRIAVYTGAGELMGLVFKPMLRLDGTSSDFEPYQIGVGQRTNNGYIVPLSVNGNTVNIPIGNAPLTAGQSVSKASTGVDIAAIAGSNTITTELYNKPEMAIEGVDYVGVGEYVNGQWQIPLTVSDGTNTTTVNIPIDAPLTASDTATKASTGVDIPTYVGTNTIGTTLENKPEMLVYYGYKGVGEHSGDTWELYFITSANGNQQLTKITMNKPLRAGETLTSEQAGVTIPTYADTENTLSLYPSAAGYGNPEMTITYKGG